MNGNLSGAGKAARNQGLGSGDKIAKRIGLFGAAPVHEPIMTAGTPAANMGDGVDKAPINKAQSGDRKRGRNGDAVRAIAIEQNRRTAVKLCVFVIKK